MHFPAPESPFGITHPLGLPRPLDPDNFFGARALFFARNLMPVPTGCLAHFDLTVYRPYVKSIVALLADVEPGWEGPGFMDEPPRYCLVRDGMPAHLPPDLGVVLPEPPRVRLEAVLSHFDRTHAHAPALQLLDLLTLIAEDLGAVRFTAATQHRPWVKEFLR